MSILLVIAGHLAGGVGTSALLSAFGVQVFFVLSGYLITMLLQKEHEREGKISLAAFYRRRCFRIFPAAYLYIFVIALASPASRSGVLYAATYTVSYHLNSAPPLYDHLWSLSVEEQFYLLWPLALLLGYRYRGRLAWLTMLAAAVFRLTLALNLLPIPTVYMHYSFPGTMDSIAAGCLLAIYEPEVRKHCAWMAQHAGIALAVAVTAWTIAVVCWGDTNIVGVRALSVAWGVVPLLIALWVFLLVEGRYRVFNNPVASSIGVLSYSLYLWQQAFTMDHRQWMPIALLMLAACASASYFLVEKPMLKLSASINSRARRHIIRRIESPATD